MSYIKSCIYCNADISFNKICCTSCKKNLFLKNKNKDLEDFSYVAFEEGNYLNAQNIKNKLVFLASELVLLIEHLKKDQNTFDLFKQQLENIVAQLSKFKKYYCENKSENEFKAIKTELNSISANINKIKSTILQMDVAKQRKATLYQLEDSFNYAMDRIEKNLKNANCTEKDGITKLDVMTWE